MANALSRLSNSLFGSRDNSPTYGSQSTTPNPSMLGTGLASNAASGVLMHEYQTHAAIAEANGEKFPTFEEWVLQRR